MEEQKIKQLDILISQIAKDIDKCCELLEINNDWQSNPEKPYIYDPTTSKVANQLQKVFQKSIGLRTAYHIKKQLQPSGHPEYPYKYVNDHGYVELFDNIENIHKRIGKLEHRYVMEKHIGCTITKNVIIHHKDQNKTNNNIENLEMMTRSHHARIHKLDIINAKT